MRCAGFAAVIKPPIFSLDTRIANTGSNPRFRLETIARRNEIDLP
jgi:hypothetical protein